MDNQQEQVLDSSREQKHDRIEKDSNGNITLLEFDSPAGKRTLQISYNDKGRISTVELTDDFNHVVTLYTYAEY